MTEVEVAVVGAGAAGLWAAAVCARAGSGVRIFEKTARTGTKILASGGTRCNLTTTLGGREAAELFRQSGARFLRPAFAALSPERVRERFAAMGVPTVEAPLAKIFPASDRARDVRDALEREARAAGAEIELDAPVVRVERGGRWRLVFQDGRSVTCRSALLCPGGQSYPRTGTTGDGYRWLRELDLPVVDPVPALVPLSSPAPWVHELTGIAWQEGEVRLALDGKIVAKRRRPVLFTHRGVSGPGAMDVSVHVAQAGAATLHLDLYPGLSRDALRARLIESARAKGSPRLARVLPGEVPRRLAEAIGQQVGLKEPNPRMMDVPKDARHRLIETLKGLAVPVDGTLGYDKAEVTAGGLALDTVDPRTMEVRGCPGLFVFGELLDLDGPIGGLNFQAAFACGELAGRAAAEQ
ncbi:MAG: aminoacetone oxidase family FAD-binding enzyme [bacterium]|nr:aminoacetone oxidase family FAD-binding enzyme [bacterium]